MNSVSNTFQIEKEYKKIVTDPKKQSSIPQVFQADGEILPADEVEYINVPFHMLSPVVNLIWKSLMNNEFDNFDFAFEHDQLGKDHIVERFNETEYVRNHLIYRDEEFIILHNDVRIVVGDVYRDFSTKGLRIVRRVYQSKSPSIDNLKKKVQFQRLSHDFGNVLFVGQNVLIRGTTCVLIRGTTTFYIH